jgi:hypothetical protein
MSTKRAGLTWLNYFLSLLCVGAIVAAVLVVGPGLWKPAGRDPHGEGGARRGAVDRLSS